MNIVEAFGWVDQYYKIYHDGPTTIGKPSGWVIESGNQCQARINRNRETPVTDRSVSFETGIAVPSLDITI